MRELPALREVHGRLVLARLHAREQRGEVLDRVMGLQPRGLVRDEAVAVRVALAERVVGERLDDVEQLRADGLAVAGRDARLDELLALARHQLADLLAACLAQVVGLGERVPAEPLRDAHHRLLVDHQPVRVAEELLHVGVEVRDRLAPVLAIGEVRVHVRRHRTGPVEGDEGGDVVEARRRERTHQRAHRPAFELEHTDRVASLQHRERGVVVERDRVDVDALTSALADQLDGLVDDRQVAQPEEVHLQQTERLDAVHLVLRHDRRFVGLLPVLGLALERDVLGELVAGDDDRRGVDAGLATQAFEATGDVDHLLDVGVDGVHLTELGRGLVAVLVLRVELEARPQGRVAAHDERRHRLRDLVADRIGVAEDPRGVAHRRPRLDRGERDDLRDVVAAVAVGGVPDHLVAVSVVEVHVDVGHLDATGVQESLEQQVVLDRVEIGDAQAVRHRAAGRAPPAGPHPDASLTRVPDQIPHDQEVGGEAHLRDHLQLEGESLGDRRMKVGAPALLGSLHREVAEVVDVVGEALGDGERRQLRLAELDLHVGALRDPQRVVAGVGPLPEEAPHLVRGLEVVLLAVELEPLRVVDRGAGLDAEQRVVRDCVVTMHVVAVVRREHRRAQRLRDVEQALHRLALRGDAVVLQLDEEVIGPEDLAEARSGRERAGIVAGEHRLQHVATEAPSRGDEALVVPVEQLPVEARLVVVALEEREARELDEVLVARLVLGEQGQVVVELLAAFGVAARVVHATAARRPLEPRLARHVRLHADDRLEVVVATGAVEVEDSVHVPVVGDADRGLTVCHRRIDDVGHSGRAIEHRELGVQVEVDERVPQCVSPSCPLVRPPRPDLHACHLHRSRTASGATWVRDRCRDAAPEALLPGPEAAGP